MRAWTELSSLGWERERRSRSGVGGELAFGPAGVTEAMGWVSGGHWALVRKAGAPSG